MAVFGFVKFRVCFKKEVNISFEPEFGNPRFETPENLNVFNFQLTCVSAIVDFIIWFCISICRETRNLELNSQLFISFMLSSKRGPFLVYLKKANE